MLSEKINETIAAFGSDLMETIFNMSCRETTATWGQD